MNITPSMIYWLTRLDEFSFMFGIVFVCIVIVALMNVIGGFYSLDSASNDQLYNRPERLAENKHNIKVRFGRAFKLALVALLVGVVNSFIPSTKQAAAIVVIPKIANSEVVAEMGDTAKELVCLAKSWLIELKPQPKTENKEEKK